MNRKQSVEDKKSKYDFHGRDLAEDRHPPFDGKEMGKRTRKECVTYQSGISTRSFKEPEDSYQPTDEEEWSVVSKNKKTVKKQHYTTENQYKNFSSDERSSRYTELRTSDRRKETVTCQSGISTRSFKEPENSYQPTDEEEWSVVSKNKKTVKKQNYTTENQYKNFNSDERNSRYIEVRASNRFLETTDFRKEREPYSNSKPRSYHSENPEEMTVKDKKWINFDKNDACLERRSITPITRGTIGQKFYIEVNYLTINMKNMPKVAYHYDVSITPDRPKHCLRAVFKIFNDKYFKDIIMAFDNKRNAYSIKKLPFKTIEESIELYDGKKSRSFVVQIKETCNFLIELDSLRNCSSLTLFEKPMRALQCIDVVLSSPCFAKGLRYGRSFYTKPRRKYDLDNGYEMWIGLFQAAILGDQPFLNVDISNKSFYSEISVLDFLSQNIQNLNAYQTMDHFTRNRAKSLLKGVDIRYEPPCHFGFAPKSFKIVDISEEGSCYLKFEMEGEKTTVDKYFAMKGYRISHPRLNCLQVGMMRKIYLPMELCMIKSQVCTKNDAPNQVGRLIKWAATSTTQRKQKIMDSLNTFNHNSDATLKMFGVSLETKFMKVPMRLIEPPKISYNGGRDVHPYDGAWRNSSEFLHGSDLSQLSKWGVVYFNRNLSTGSLKDFTKKIYHISKQLCVPIDAPSHNNLFHSKDLYKVLRELKEKRYGLVFVVIPRIGTTYADIKQTAELDCGLLTQCIKEQNLLRSQNDQIVSNILLKVNAKLNGTNHKIKNLGNLKLDGGVMFLGADVTHPAPDQRNTPSIVGVACSHDRHGFLYNMQFRFQEPTVEVIENMESIVEHHLRVYNNHQKSYPKYIFYYRDGVSDGQFPIIKKTEIRGVRKALSRLKISVKLMCLIVVKRHHTRFFPIDPTNDKFNNVPPGSIVDQIIVNPNEFEFFMVSHKSVQGTARPTRYNVIENDANVNIDDLQRLTYDLCHMFPRCNRSVSYPTPAYLAHLAAARGRVYIEGARSKFAHKLPKVSAYLQDTNPMYFV